MPSDIAGIVDLLLTILLFAVIGRALLSWFDPRMTTPIGRVLFEITEPIIAPIRNVVGGRTGMIDLSPMIAAFLIILLQRLIGSSLAT
jgi:YggT family protein